MTILKVFTDGSAIGNPGKGGWAFCFEHGTTLNASTGEFKPRVFKVQRGYRLTTNNRMELAAFIYAMFFLRYKGFIKRGDAIEIHTDSTYLMNSFNDWIPSWKKKNWKAVKNVDLMRVIDLYRDAYEVKFVKVPAHSGIPLNELADSLARDASDRERLYIDYNYENNKTT